MSIKKIIFVSCVLYIFPMLGSQPTDQRCGNYGRKLAKKALLHVGPNRNQQQRHDAWEWFLAKKAQKMHSPKMERAILEYYQLYGRILATKLASEYDHRQGSGTYYRISCSRPLTAALLCTMLIFAPKAALALQQEPPAKGPSLWTCSPDPVQLIKCQPNAPLNGLLYGHLQPVADGLNEFSRWYNNFETEHEHIAKAALSTAMVTLKTVFGGIIGAVETKSAAGTAASATAAGGIAIFEEVEGAFAHAVLGDVIDQVAEYGAEHGAQNLMEYDPECSPECAVQVASFGTALGLSIAQFQHFIKHFPTYDFTRLGASKGLLKLSQAKIPFSEITPEVATMLKHGTPHVGMYAYVETTINPQKNKREATPYQPIMEDVQRNFNGEHMPPLSGTVYEPYMRNAAKIIESPDLAKTLEHIEMEPYKRLFDIQMHQETQRDHFAGTAYQPYINYATEILRTDNLKDTLWRIDNEPAMRMIDRHFHDLPPEPFAGTVYEPLMRTAASYFQDKPYAYANNAYEQCAQDWSNSGNNKKWY